jgi:hypothetical protein
MGVLMSRRILSVLAAVGLSALNPTIPANAQATAGQWQLMWFAVVATPQGPAGLRTPESTAFATETDCAAFGERTAPRMQDWVRGLIRADWSHEVRVAFKCEPAGTPS